MSVIAIHQPNFIPHLPFFDKLNKADIFVMLVHCQFEKNGFQNRSLVDGNWWSCPVQSGNLPIKDKRYTTGIKLVNVNMAWINAICMTLGIDTSKIRLDFQTDNTGTERIVEICKQFECDRYLTNPTATDKYLDEKELNDNGIELVAHEFDHKLSIFEAFNTMGIDKVRKILERERRKFHKIGEIG